MRRLLLLLFISFSSLAFAQTGDVTKTVTGYGSSYQKALNQALIQGVQQVRGTEVSTDRQLQSSMEHIISQNTISHSQQINEVQNVFTDSQGWIKSYQVTQVNEPKSDDGQWRVTASVVVPKYESKAKNDKRATLAIMPFRVSERVYDVYQQRLDAFGVSQSLQEHLQSDIIRSNRFALVNREYGEEFASEKALLSSNNVSAETASRIGEVAGADYMLVGRIQNFSHPPQAKRDFYGAKINEGLTRLEISYQLVEVASQRIAWSDVARVDARLVDRDDTIDVIYEKAAQQIGKLIAANAYNLEKGSVEQASSKQEKRKLPARNRNTPGSSDKPIKWD